MCSARPTLLALRVVLSAACALAGGHAISCGGGCVQEGLARLVSTKYEHNEYNVAVVTIQRYYRGARDRVRPHATAFKLGCHTRACQSFALLGLNPGAHACESRCWSQRCVKTRRSRSCSGLHQTSKRFFAAKSSATPIKPGTRSLSYAHAHARAPSMHVDSKLCLQLTQSATLPGA